jgi:hypothetical protein
MVPTMAELLNLHIRSQKTCEYFEADCIDSVCLAILASSSDYIVSNDRMINE